MRLTNKLYAQHLGWMFKKHWQVQGKRTPNDTGAKSALNAIGIEVKDASLVLKPPRTEFEKIEIIGYKPPEIKDDETHPNWHTSPCHIYGDSNVLLAGVPQAQNLIKSIVVEGLPKNLEEALSKSKISSAVDKHIQNSILSSHVFDAEQKKLPIVKIPERPMFVLPRQYGITSSRKNRLLISKLIFECEKLGGKSITSQRKILNHPDFLLTIQKGEDKIQFNIGAETMVTSKIPLSAIKESVDGEIPDLSPIKDTISIPCENIYIDGTSYPLRNTLNFTHPHTIFLHYSKETVKNLHGTEVSTTQLHSRAMIKAFTVAASKARQLYGDSNKLEKPIVVQSIQTNGKTFHFGIFQLNTLNLEGTDGVNNYWFNLPNMDLFAECGYRVGKPILEGYNKDVFRIISAFYNNC